MAYPFEARSGDSSRDEDLVCSQPRPDAGVVSPSSIHESPSHHHLPSGIIGSVHTNILGEGMGDRNEGRVSAGLNIVRRALDLKAGGAAINLQNSLAEAEMLGNDGKPDPKKLGDALHAEVLAALA